MRDAECIVDEGVLLRYALEPSLSRDWDGFVADVRAAAQAVIELHGAFVMTENHGLFTCRGARDAQSVSTGAS